MAQRLTLPAGAALHASQLLPRPVCHRTSHNAGQTAYRCAWQLQQQQSQAEQGTRLPASSRRSQHHTCRATAGPSSAPPPEEDPQPATSSPSSSSSDPSSPPDASSASSQSTPWSQDDLEAMVAASEERDDAQLGSEWMSYFEDDPEALYDYVDASYLQAMIEGPDKVDTHLTTMLEEAGEGPFVKFPGPMANDIVGMGTWRLRDRVDSVVEFMVGRLEGAWRDALDDDLCLYPAEKWKEPGYDFADSVDPAREWDGWAWSDVPNPEKGEPGYPRLLLENRIYCSRVFRKLHIEVGWRQDGLQVLHMVMFPRYSYDCPLLCMDLVVAGGRVSLAIVDACPVRKDLSLPPHYMQAMKMLQDTYLPDAPAARKIPEWGTNIFSPMCVCISPQDPAQLAGFVKYALALHRAHLQLSTLLQPIAPAEARSRRRLDELLESHKRFVSNHLDNKKTRRVLDASFGEEWAQRYMSEVMFDFSPDFNPPYYDSSVDKLYDYFEYNPELGDPGFDDSRAIQEGLTQERAAGFLAGAADGGRVSPARIEWALTQMYETDPEFRQAVQVLLPHVDELHEQGMLGKALAAQLQGLGPQPGQGQQQEVAAASSKK